ncbi:uncharacterized protein LOC118432405 isoform X3 [Branchiostoma floridae]|uniref:Uncharacterized protein LOC118432405 isoform X1 n=1 Tax=Branchiostoma floridae TaxID=7739 RepID=A0A9J7MGV5_BRAFL|nr:uncharacterized protein LOC118432405 isoform X1 [Branchiostoma floridae]XP_035699855.1 uncharacterized protein LOC118432405 isoform X2 [Branchiostoma floridae]XP_035699856.1 uncharacterized protein LOC118432405 isoform X3 [Branchiostoma floridae]
MWTSGGQVLSLVLTAVVVLVPSSDSSVPPPEIQDEVNKCMLTLGLHKVIPHISSVKMAMDFCMAKVARAQSDGFHRTAKNAYPQQSSYHQQQSSYSNSQQSPFSQQQSSPQAAYMSNAISPYDDSGADNKQFDPKTYDGAIEECSEKSFLAGKCVEMTDWLVNMVNTVAPQPPPPPPPPKCVADFAHCGYCECNCCSGKCELSWLLWEASVCVPENKCSYSRVTKCVNQKKINR